MSDLAGAKRRTRRPVYPFCLMGSIALFSPSRAEATDPPVAKPEDSALIAKARQLYEEGFSAYKKQRWADARAALLAAWSLHRHWQIAGSLAACETQLGRDRDAAEHAAYYALNAPLKWREQALRLLAQMRSKVAAVTVRVNVDGAEVRLDGELLGAAPLGSEVFVEPGKHTLESTRNGFQDAREGIEAKAGETIEVALRLEPAAAVVAGPVLPPPPLPPVARPIWPVAVGAGATVVMLGVGIGFTVAANRSTADVATLLKQVGGRSGCTGAPTGDLAQTCASLHNAVAGHDTFSKAALASFIVGGALALGTAGLGVWTWKSKPSAMVQVAPIVGTRHGGAMLMGAW